MKPIQILQTVSTEVEQGNFYVLCDDGTIWVQVYRYDRDDQGFILNRRHEWDLVEFNPKWAAAKEVKG